MTSKRSRLLPSPKPQFLSFISIRRIFERAQVSCERTENWIICDWYKQVYKILAVMWNGIRTYTLLCRMSIIMVAVPKKLNRENNYRDKRENKRKNLEVLTNWQSAKGTLLPAPISNDKLFNPLSI